MPDTPNISLTLRIPHTCGCELEFTAQALAVPSACGCCNIMPSQLFEALGAMASNLLFQYAHAMQAVTKGDPCPTGLHVLGVCPDGGSANALQKH